MTYIDLGRYLFTTAADYGGFNTGNLTSVLDPSAIRIANYELYRLVINTAAVPPQASLPSVVQTAAPVVGSSLTALSITFAKPTTKGNLVVAGVSGGSQTGNDPVVTGITLGGVADNWGAVASALETNGNSATLWADPATTQASTAIAVTLGSGTGSGVQTTGMAWEIAGCLTTSSATGCVDVSGTAAPSSFSTTVTTPNTLTTAANDMQIGFGAAASTPAAFTLSQPQGYPTQFVPGQLMGGTLYGGSAGSHRPTGGAGSSTAYGLAASASSFWNVVTAAFLPSAAVPVPVPFPFTVAIDGTQWDAEVTVAGVGYTYNIGQSPLILRSGQSLQIFWGLSAAAYLSSASAFQIAGWFRYDPSIQP